MWKLLCRGLAVISVSARGNTSPTSARLIENVSVSAGRCIQGDGQSNIQCSANMVDQSSQSYRKPETADIFPLTKRQHTLSILDTSSTSVSASPPLPTDPYGYPKSKQCFCVSGSSAPGLPPNRTNIENCAPRPDIISKDAASVNKLIYDKIQSVCSKEIAQAPVLAPGQSEMDFPLYPPEDHLCYDFSIEWHKASLECENRRPEPPPTEDVCVAILWSNYLNCKF